MYTEFADMHALTDIYSLDTPTAVKRTMKPIADKTKVKFCKIHTPEEGRKQLCSEQNRLAVEALINDQLNQAGKIETEIKTKRMEAAAKINEFWRLKSIKISLRKNAQSQPLVEESKKENSDEQLPQISSSRLTRLKCIYDAPQVQRAGSGREILFAALDEADSLARSLTYLLGSIFVKSSLDQQFILEKLKIVQSYRDELMAFVKATFVESNTNITISVMNDLNTRVVQLRTHAKREQTLLDEWLAKNDGELAVVEQKKQQFRRMEKWNAVFT